MPRNIVLIHPPWFFKKDVAFLSQNLALGYLAGFLLKKGHHVAIIDALAEGEGRIVNVKTPWGRIKQAGLSYEDIARRIPPETDIIGITAPFTHHAIIIRELSVVLKNAFPLAAILLGGVYPSTLPENALTGGVDYIIKGEGEIPLSRFADGEDPLRIRGLWYRDKKGGIIGSDSAEMVRSLDDIPFPARHLLPMEKYHRLSSRGRLGKRSATVITSRGCPFDCTFCSVHAVYGWQWRARSPENIIEELKLLRDRFGIEHIEFEDDNLTLDIRRAEAIFDGMTGLGLTWSCSNGIRIDRLDRALLVKMKESGCSVLNLGIEHGDPEMLGIMNKKLDLQKVEEVMATCLELEIPTVGFWVICHPGETRDHFERGLEYFKKLKDRGMYAFGVHPAWPLPGTRLYQMCRENGWLTVPDSEECLIFPGPFYIECPDFDRHEAARRLARARSVLEVNDETFGNASRLSAFRSSIAAAALGYRFCKTNPAHLGDKHINGFYPPETTPNGFIFRWSKPRASIIIKPVSRKSKKLTAKIHSIQDKPIMISANGAVVFDGRVSRGTNELNIELGASSPFNGRISLELVTRPTIPKEMDPGSKDLRELGVVVRWLKLS